MAVRIETGETVALFGRAGGREAAIVDGLLRKSSPKELKALYVAPGNDAIENLERTDSRLKRINVSSYSDWLRLAQEKGVTLGFVGPEQPLIDGIVDKFGDIPIVGPDRKAARLEGSKIVSKLVMSALGIPTAEWASFSDPVTAKAYVDSLPYQVVVKADGLAGGKGVDVCDDSPDAYRAIDKHLVQRVYGDASSNIVIERRLYGPEFSHFIGLDGKRGFINLPTARDYKGRDIGNKGPNTGGMGAYSPIELITPERHKKIMERIVYPLVNGLNGIFKINYRGILFIGGLIDGDNPYGIEFNVRWGDPEAQVIIPRLESFLELLIRMREGTLSQLGQLQFSAQEYACLVLASRSYPDTPRTDQPISGIENVRSGAYVIHAGTKYNDDRSGWLVNGGRVINIVAGAKTRREAGETVHRESEKILFDGKFKRDDVALDDL